MANRLSLWFSDEEEKEIAKFRKKAKEDSRSLGSYIKRIIFNKNENK